MPHTVSIPHWLGDLCASYSKTQKFHRQLFGWSSLRSSLTVCSLNLNPKPTSASGPRGPLPFSLDDLTGKRTKSVRLYSFLLRIHLLSLLWIYKACGWGLGWVCVGKSLSCARLFVIPWTVARQAPLSMGFFQARILEWVAISLSRRSGRPLPGSRPRHWTQVSCIVGRHFTIWATRELCKHVIYFSKQTHVV